MANNYYPYQEPIQNSLGQIVATANITIFAQTGLGVPNTSNLANVYAFANGAVQLPNPIYMNNGITPHGMTLFYAAPGYYTLQVSGNYILTQNIPDIAIGPITSTGFVLTNSNVVGNANGINTIFTLNSTPNTPSAVILTQNGIVMDQTSYSINGNVVTFTSAPLAGNGDMQAFFTTNNN